MSDVRCILGIDLAVKAADTGLCVLHRTGASWKVEAIGDPHARTVDGLVDRICDVLDGGQVAIDSPFGWPRDWIELLAATRQIEGHLLFPQRGEVPGLQTALRLRATDRLVAARKLRATPASKPVVPMSASTDKLAATTARCVEILALASARLSRPISRTGSDGIWEVYPAASLAVWGFERDSLAGGRARQHERFHAACRAHPSLVMDDAPRNEHDLDALAAALTIAGPFEPTHGVAADDAELEGLIHLPSTAEPLFAGGSPAPR